MKNYKVLLKHHFLLILLILIGIFYVGNTWSPSSYGAALRWIGAADAPVFSTYKDIRSDEWAVQTSLTKALVNNKLQRYNHTSIYKEDFRINYGLPIMDWGMLFKPAYWGYMFLPPAYAFSLYYFLLFSFFVTGYSSVIEKIGVTRLQATLLAFAIYNTGAVQFWWTSNASTFTYFPWVLLSAYAIRKSVYAAIPLFWFLVAWQLGNVYPPFSIGLAFCGLAWFSLVGGYKFISLWRWILIALVCAAAGAVVYGYYYDYLHLMKSIVYPGMRQAGGGTIASWWMLPTHLFPTLLFGNNFALIDEAKGGNICESGTWATLLLLMMIFFARTTLHEFKVLSSKIWFALLLLAITLAWLVIPLSPNMGKILLLNKVHPIRLMAVWGLLLHLILIYYAVHMHWKVILSRLALFWLVFIAEMIIYKMGWLNVRGDMFAAMLAFSCMFYLLMRKSDARMIAIVGVACFSVLRFFSFNPIQDAKMIFSPPATDLTRGFERMQKEKGFIDLAGPGATINGLGYLSVAHVNTTPQVAFWSKKFPNIGRDELMNVFNRYAHIQITDDQDIRVGGPDLVFVPRRCFAEGLAKPCLNVKVESGTRR